MVTAKANGVNTMLLTWPSFVFPDDAGKESHGVKTSSADSARSESGWVMVGVGVCNFGVFYTFKIQLIGEVFAWEQVQQRMFIKKLLYS